MKIHFATIKDIDKLVDTYSEWSKFQNILPITLIQPETHNNLIKYFDGSNTTRIYLLAVDDIGVSLGACYIGQDRVWFNRYRS